MSSSKSSKSSKSNKNTNIPEENIQFSNIQELDDHRNVYLNYDVTKNKLSPIMNKFEKALIIGKRSEMFDGNAMPLIDVPEGLTDPIEIAELELKQGKNPMIIERDNNGVIEYWKVRDLIVDLS